MKRTREAAAQPTFGPENSKNTTERLAALDVGTHAAKLWVVSATREGAGFALEPLARLGMVTRLGEGGGIEGGPIPAVAEARAAAAIRALKAKAQGLGVDTWVAAGTGVFRRAANGRTVARRLGMGLGSALPVLSPVTEAALSLLGARAGATAEPPLLGIDLGGGSTELIYLGASPARFETRSLELGCLKLAEQHFPPGAGRRGGAALRRALVRVLPRPLYRGPEHPAPTWLAIGGTATALATMDLRLPQHDPERVHGHRLTEEALAGLVEMLVDEVEIPDHRRTVARRFHRQPATVLLSGALLLSHLMAIHAVRSVVVSTSGLRQGLVLGELLSRRGPAAGDPRRSSRRAIALALSSISSRQQPIVVMEGGRSKRVDPSVHPQ